MNQPKTPQPKTPYIEAVEAGRAFTYVRFYQQNVPSGAWQRGQRNTYTACWPGSCVNWGGKEQEQQCK